ncbi:MAG: hypothetical protein HYS06_03260 [Methylocystis sp.]|nr:hypothetical protein [Methylocystis sp.]
MQIAPQKGVTVAISIHRLAASHTTTLYPPDAQRILEMAISNTPPPRGAAPYNFAVHYDFCFACALVSQRMRGKKVSSENRRLSARA